jgi:subtilase family serine protease
MRSLRAPLVAAASLLAVAGLAIPAHANAGGVPNQPDKSAQPDKPERRVCAAEPAEGFAACDAHVVTKGDGVTPDATTTWTSGFQPSDLQAAYTLPSGTAGSGQTIAIVDAYNDPNAEADLGVYRSRFGLGDCTTANGCFKKVDQNGGTSYPSGDVGWAQEISLDLDMASATCPHCKILLVEAKSASFADLGAAVNRAALMGANAISNSYGGREFSGEASYEGPYNHPGIAVTVSSGDAGYGVEFPASSRYVTAVGGTSLKRSSTLPRGWTETAWSKAGSGCSAYITKPQWQTDTGCSRRTVADVSAVADPYTGVAVYDSYGSSGGANWYVFGGTSVSSPIIAGVYALAGHAGINASFVPNSNLYTHTSNLFDVVGGKNGNCKRQVAYLCTGLAGYDGPTGLGTPNGIGAF